MKKTRFWRVFFVPSLVRTRDLFRCLGGIPRTWLPILVSSLFLVFSGQGMLFAVDPQASSECPAPGLERLPMTVSTSAPPETPCYVQTLNVASTSFELNWGIVDGATGYELYGDGPLLPNVSSEGHSPNPEAASWGLSLRMMLPASPASLLLPGLDPGFRSTFRVLARNDEGCSSLSMPVSVLLPSIDLKVGSVTQDSVTLAWMPVSGASGYGVIRANPWSDVGGRLLATFAADVASCTIEGLSPSRQLAFRLIASMSSANEIEVSQAVPVELVPATPLKPMFSDVGLSRIRLEWFPVMGATSYRIFRDQKLHIGTVPGGSTSALLSFPSLHGYDISLTVVARNGSGDSPPSPPLKISIASQDRVEESKEETADPTDIAEAHSLKVGDRIPNFGFRDSNGSPQQFYDWVGMRSFVILFLDPSTTALADLQREYAEGLNYNPDMEGISPIIQVRKREEPVVGKSRPDDGPSTITCLDDPDERITRQIFRQEHFPSIVLLDGDWKVIGIDTISRPPIMIDRILDTLGRLPDTEDSEAMKRYRLRKLFQHLHHEVKDVKPGLGSP